MNDIRYSLQNLFLHFKCEECKEDTTQPFLKSNFYIQNEADIDSIEEYVEAHLSFDEIDLLCSGTDITIELPSLLCSNKQCKRNSLQKRKNMIINSINVPALYKDVSPIKSAIAEFAGKPGVFYIGKVGSGKTYSSIALLKKLIMDKGGPTKCTYKFINASTLFFMYQEEIDKHDRDENSILRQCMNVDFLVLDDLGTEKSSISKTSQLYMIINDRLENLKLTIVTSNFTNVDQIQSGFSERIASRFSLYKVREVLGNDRRKN
jgi:DNA replication protein DnaC